ncbi:MAG: hypothetical protein ACXVQT_10850, partial [Actinomycetota bacterium]
MLLVDAANVVGSRPNGWWRDRPGAARELVARVRRSVVDGNLTGPVLVVLEGQAKQGVDAGIADGVEVVHAPGHGDDTLVAVATESDEPVVLVSAVRELAERVRRCGADVVGPAWLVERLP